MLPRLAFAVIASVAISPKAEAQFLTANSLYEQLLDNQTAVNAHALGFIIGVFDSTLRSTQCAPVGVTARQALDMVKANLVKFPEHRNAPASVFVEATFTSAWPCPQKPTKGNV